MGETGAASRRVRVCALPVTPPATPLPEKSRASARAAYCAPGSRARYEVYGVTIP